MGLLGHTVILFLVVVFKIYLFYLYLFSAVLGLCHHAQAFSNCSEWGLLFVAIRGLLIAVPSVVSDLGL